MVLPHSRHDTQHISLFISSFNERYWAPVFASQVLTEDPGLTWVVRSHSTALFLHDTPTQHLIIYIFPVYAPSTATPRLLSSLFQSFLHLMQLSISWRRTAHQPQRGYLEHTIQAERAAALTSCHPLCNDESSSGGVKPPITDDGAGTCFTRLSPLNCFLRQPLFLSHSPKPQKFPPSNKRRTQGKQR